VRWPHLIRASKAHKNLDDGYRLTYGGYDYLAVQALLKRDSIFSFGNQIGVGKEAGEPSAPPETDGHLIRLMSDIYMVADAEGNDMVIKIHRCGYSVVSVKP
jgi:RIO kinase 2